METTDEKKKNGNGETRLAKQDQSRAVARKDDDELEVEIIDGVALEAITSAEIDRQIATARAYPRSITLARANLMELATLDPATAEQCHYALPRDGKTIEGPSVRFAELAACAWGNLRFGGRIVTREQRFVVAQGFCHDLEKNNAIAFEVRRRIVTKTGKRFNDDMQGVTENAACSIAMRNAILRIVPKALWNAAYEAALKVADGDEMSIEQRRANALKAYQEKGVAQDRVLAALGRKGLDDVTIDDLRYLRGMMTAIKSGELTVEAAMRTPEEREAEKRGPASTTPSDLLAGEGAAK